MKEKSLTITKSVLDLFTNCLGLEFCPIVSHSAKLINHDGSHKAVHVPF